MRTAENDSVCIQTTGRRVNYGDKVTGVGVDLTVNIHCNLKAQECLGKQERNKNYSRQNSERSDGGNSLLWATPTLIRFPALAPAGG